MVSASVTGGFAAFGTGALVAELDPGLDLETVLQQYGDEIRRCRYGSFRGVIKNGKVVIFAVEHEWRPQQEAGRTRGQPTEQHSRPELAS
jgi:hypothetical protein